jgi:hypothetical protein
VVTRRGVREPVPGRGCPARQLPPCLAGRAVAGGVIGRLREVQVADARQHQFSAFPAAVGNRAYQHPHDARAGRAQQTGDGEQILVCCSALPRDESRRMVRSCASNPDDETEESDGRRVPTAAPRIGALRGPARDPVNRSNRGPLRAGRGGGVSDLDGDVVAPHPDRDAAGGAIAGGPGVAMSCPQSGGGLPAPRSVDLDVLQERRQLVGEGGSEGSPLRWRE